MNPSGVVPSIIGIHAMMRDTQPVGGSICIVDYDCGSSPGFIFIVDAVPFDPVYKG